VQVHDDNGDEEDDENGIGIQVAEKVSTSCQAALATPVPLDTLGSKAGNSVSGTETAHFTLTVLSKCCPFTQQWQRTDLVRRICLTCGRCHGGN
jgi:hypothetical protein